MSRLSLLLALGLCGCSLLNKPDDSLINGPDGADAGEAGVDAGDAGDADPGDAGDAGPDAGPPPVEVCDNNMDDDGDTLVDCSDLDCSGFAGCCATDGEADMFAFSRSSGDWLVQGNPVVAGTRVQFSPTVGDPDTMTSDDCYPLAQGAEFRPVFQFAGEDPTCASGSCEQYAAFYVSTVGMRPERGGRIGSEFSMTVYRSGLVEFRLGGGLIDSLNLPPAVAGGRDSFTMVLTLTPTTDAEGVKRVAVTVGVNDDIPTELGPQLYAEDLTSGCSSVNSGGEGIPGLLFGIEGTGSAVEIGEVLRAKVLECTNPSVFRRDLNELPLAASGVAGPAAVRSLGWSADDEGGMAWPELVRLGPTRWQVLGSRTDQQPILEPVTPGFRWDIASAENDDFRSAWDRDSVPEYFARASQPTAVLFSSSLYVVARVEGQLRFGLDTPTMPWMPPAGTCDSVSHPALAIQPDDNVGPGSVEQFVMFYVCERGGTTTVRWRRHKTTLDLALQNDGEVLNLTAFGRAASAQVKDLTVLVDQRGDDDILVRLWVVGQDPILGESLLLATGQYKLSAGPEAALSLFSYSGNPVGTASSLLERGLGEIATLEGVAVERESDTSPRLRFLMSRRLEYVGGGRRWDFVPMTQVWGEL